MQNLNDYYYIQGLKSTLKWPLFSHLNASNCFHNSQISHKTIAINMCLLRINITFIQIVIRTMLQTNSTQPYQAFSIHLVNLQLYSIAISFIVECKIYIRPFQMWIHSLAPERMFAKRIFSISLFRHSLFAVWLFICAFNKRKRIQYFYPAFQQDYMKKNGVYQTANGSMAFSRLFVFSVFGFFLENTICTSIHVIWMPAKYFLFCRGIDNFKWIWSRKIKREQI